MEWRAIRGYPGFEVSDEGTVRRRIKGDDPSSIYDTGLVRGAPDLPYESDLRWRPVSLTMERGKPRVWLVREDGKRVKAFLRPIVLEAFIGPPKGGVDRRTRHACGKRGVGAELRHLRWVVDAPKAREQRRINWNRKRAILRSRSRARRKAMGVINWEAQAATDLRLRILDAARSGKFTREQMANRFGVTEEYLRNFLSRAACRFRRKEGRPEFWFDRQSSEAAPHHDRDVIRGVIEAIGRGENYGDIARHFGFKGHRAKCVVAGIAFRARRRCLERKGDPSLWLATPPRDATEHRILAMAHARAQGRRLSIAQDTVRRTGRLDRDLDPDRLAVADGRRPDLYKALPVG